MTYPQTLEYLYETLPMFQRVGSIAYKGDLSNTLALCHELGDPQHKFKSVHIAGTNGKGSSSHMIAAILQCAGYKTGLYTSPHLKDFTERIKINGIDVTRDFVVDFVGRIRPALEKIHPSFFETTVAMAFDYFVRERTDIAVIEVGLGGRLDSTNVITPQVSLITNIGYDHKNILGDTLPKIASEKAGIIKPGVPVVISERQDTVEAVFITKAAAGNSPIAFASDEYRVVDRPEATGGVYDVYRHEKILFEGLECQLKGRYQKRNISGVLKTIDQLREQGLDIPGHAIRQGIEQVVTLTGLKGRWQKLGDRPMIICDTGHNEDGIREVVGQLESTPHRRLHFVCGMVNDKDITALLAQLPKTASYYFCQAKIPRALPANDLAAQALEAGLQGIVIDDVNDAIKYARSIASPDDLIFIGGSTFVVAEIENL